MNGMKKKCPRGICACIGAAAGTGSMQCQRWYCDASCCDLITGHQYVVLNVQQVCMLPLRAVKR